jgi:hypothetical protein
MGIMVIIIENKNVDFEKQKVLDKRSLSLEVI